MQLQGIKIVSRPVYRRPSIKGGRSAAVAAVNPDDLRPGALSGDAWSATIDMPQGRIYPTWFQHVSTQVGYLWQYMVSPTSSLASHRTEAAFGGPATE